MSVVISSGHGLHCRGASGILDEVDEARAVVETLAECLAARGVEVMTFHDNTSHDQSTNLETIVNYHNAQERELDISVHFNAYIETSSPMGCEVLYVSQATLAAEVSLAIAEAGRFINRGAKLRSDLYFLNNTNQKAILLEICFVDSSKDADLYHKFYGEICDAIAATLVGEELEPLPEAPISLRGRVSWFGGPNDTGVTPDEGLAFIYDVEDAPYLFLPRQPEGTTGLARRLNSNAVHYIALRFDYDEMPKEEILKHVALVRNPKTGFTLRAYPADWGPNEEETGRVADISPRLMEDLGLTTDDEVEVIFPAPKA